MKEELSIQDLDFILESLKYTRLKFENYPIGENGYPSYEYKQKRLDEVNDVVKKIGQIKRSISK